MIIDRDLWSSPIDRMVFGDSLRMYLTLAPVPLPSGTPKTARVLNGIHGIQKLKNLFSGRSRANLNLFLLAGNKGLHVGVFFLNGVLIIK
jgi:hypothetical protein